MITFASDTFRNHNAGWRSLLALLALAFLLLSAARSTAADTTRPASPALSASSGQIASWTGFWTWHPDLHQWIWTWVWIPDGSNAWIVS